MRAKMCQKQLCGMLCPKLFHTRCFKMLNIFNECLTWLKAFKACSYEFQHAIRNQTVKLLPSENLKPKDLKGFCSPVQTVSSSSSSLISLQWVTVEFFSRHFSSFNKSLINLSRFQAAIFKTRNGESVSGKSMNGNGERGTGNGESLIARIFKSGNL